MIKSYQFSDSLQIAPHFNTREFECKCGKSHDMLISSDLISKLELLHQNLNCSKIIITSGYRCSTHDRAVGGNGSGQHTKGTAADICCYGQDGNPISSKIVCCTAQDIGFTGIANINESYQYTHVDVRTGYRWLGDEVKGNNTVTNDFYSYYGIKKEAEQPKNANLGIDVSENNGNVNWSHVRTDGVKFAIIRAGYGKELSQKDKQFENNYAGCKSNGIPAGVFWYSYATNADEAKQEAATFLEIVKGKVFELPVYFDIEDHVNAKGEITLKLSNLGKTRCTEIAKAFLETVENAGYYVGIYASKSVLESYIDDSIKGKYAVWVAQYNTSCTYSNPYGIWQNSDKGKIYGVDGAVDTDYCYVNYTSAIKEKGLNGFKVASDDSISVEVTVDGKKYSGKLNKA